MNIDCNEVGIATRSQASDGIFVGLLLMLASAAIVVSGICWLLGVGR